MRQPSTILELPSCVEVEESLLGSLLSVPDMIPRVKAFLKPEAFYLTVSRDIYEAILYLYDQDRAIDLVSLSNNLDKGGVLDQIGGPGYLTDLIARCPTGYHAETYASDIVDDYTKRQAIDVAAKLAQAAYTANGNIGEVISQAQSRLSAAAGNLAQDDNTIDLKSSVNYYLDLLEQRAANQDRPKLKYYLWPTLNRLMPELGLGDLTSVLAESGVGKTVFLENCAEDWARRGWKVAFFHLELNEQTMMDRRMQRLTGVPITKLREPERFTPDEWDAVLAAGVEVEGWPGNIHYVHCPGWTSDQIVSKAIALDETEGIDIVIVDYFNKIKTEPTNGMNYAQARGYDIEVLKTVIEKYHWRGLMAAQFDKASNHKNNKRGSDARDTGELEQKSNVVMVIDRPLEDGNQRSRTGQIQVVKCNAGQEGSITVQYYGKHLKYGEMTNA